MALKSSKSLPMEFDDNKPIYRQITDYAFNSIISGRWREGVLIPSVRELSAELGVNARTVLKALEYLQQASIIEPRRGMGFLLSADATARVLAERRKEFYDKLIPSLCDEMKRLDISEQELFDAIRNIINH